MFSTFIRLGAALSCAAMLSSCGGNSVAETQQSTPEGIFASQNNVTSTEYKVTFNGPNANSAITTAPPATCYENVITFAVATGSIYTFYPSSNNPAVLNAADYGGLTFSGGAMSSSLFEVIAPPALQANLQPAGSNFSAISSNYSQICDSFTGGTATANLTGAYNTDQNIAGTLTFGTADGNGWFNVTTFNINYDADYQGVQSLSTLAGTYNGYVSTSQFAEPATFTIGPASVPANAGNDLGVSVLTGTGASGCSYTGSVSPLYKGNGYTVTMSSGSYPCVLPQTQFSGLIYLNTTTNILYSFAPNAAHSDGVLFSGTRS